MNEANILLKDVKLKKENLFEYDRLVLQDSSENYINTDLHDYTNDIDF